MEIVCIALSVYSLVLFARIILSWVTMAWSPPAGLAPVIKVIYDLTEPIMGFMRRIIPPMGGLDISPIFIFIGIRILQSALCSGRIG